MRTSRSLRDPAAIAASCEEVLARLPGQATLHRHAVLALLRLKRWEDAERHIAALRALDPGGFDTHDAAAALARARGDREAALQDTRAMLALKPGDEALVRRCIGDLLELGRSAEASAQLEEGMRALADPGSLIASTLGTAHRLRAYDFVRENGGRAIELMPGHATLPTWLVVACRALGRLAEAEAPLLKALAARPDEPEVATALGVLHLELERLEEARGMFWRACRLDPSRPAPWLHLAGIEKRFTIAGPLPILAEARRMGAESAAGIVLEAKVLTSLGRLAEADRCMARGQARWPEDRGLQAYRLERNIELGRLDEAAGALAALPSPAPEERARRLTTAARIALQKFEAEEALEAYRAAAAADPALRAAHDGIMSASLMRLRVEEAHAAVLALRKLNAADRRARKLPPQPLRSLLVPVVNEGRIHIETARLGREALETGGLPALLRVHRAAPDFTVTALAAMVELRRLGHLEPALPDRSASIVPRLIHQFWDTPKAPPDVAELMTSWAERNPGWAWRRYDRVTAREYLARHCHPDVGRAFRLAVASPARQADLLRLAALHVEGGVYADADDLCVAPLDAELGGGQLILRQEMHGTIGNNFMAAVPGHPVIAIALEDATTAILRGDSESIWMSTGPGLLTRSLAHYLAQDERRLDALGRDIVVLERWNLLRFCAVHVRTSYKARGAGWLSQELQQGVR